ncbi:chromosomal replication initiator protein DnaA [Methylocystis sp. MJC1]|jgi:chromosomal replication initiator protein|uniref:chromosomal replication initiator protein DnaA n=1 Tax=Methylocystis sp. MJC1 TaxID=2654282 RepID=UPI0013EA2947|nr:chromosomal replication initiator protein DnaA [Methylocystis sp. MJC1]KAF2989510.1 Chromosomal replication initiator protein DnaA [Methylocystis sp. MJC1]MBU6527900.1 chromosomal replication initiator protein DnaA [Methylocystis sp. MJC1]UZX10822.1 chromosomal replication initiator protein DnaA [Methylocystis sp. MJC1]
MLDRAMPNDGISPEDQKRWEGVRQRLRAELGDAVYSSWFTRLELDRLTGQTIYLSVPTKFLKSWVQSHYASRIKARVSNEFESVEHVVIDVRSSARKAKLRDGAGESDAHTPHLAEKPQTPYVIAAEPIETPAAQRRPARPVAPRGENDSFVGSPLDRRLSFSTFLVGPSNQLAYAAACRVADARPGDTPMFNPLYAHAAVGLGKTHLLQALAHATNDNRRRAVYLTAERFMSGFVSSLTTQTAHTFKERLRAIDMLIIDDVQFLQGKSIQQEFCHTLNALIDAGRQVVVAADRPPSDLETLDERVLSRFKGGLCVDIGPLDESLRAKILGARIAAAQEMQPGFHVPPDVINYVARTIVTNGRDLEGAVNRLLAHVTLNGAPLTVETAETAIRDLVRTQEPKRVKIDDIQKLVASHYNISRSDILSSRRTANVVRPRQIAMYLSKVLTLRSLPEIGRRFGGRDHTTVLHAVRKIEELVSKDKSLAEVIDLLKRILNEQ